MLPDEVRKAVEYVDQIFDDADNGEWAAIKAHLLAREAEVERLQAELGDYRTNGASAVRFAPNSAHWSNELKRLFGEDARTGIGVLEKWHCDSQARAERDEALLRECRRFVAWASERLPEALPIYEKLDAHLSENGRVP